MKHIILFTLVIFLAACKKDVNPFPEPSNQLPQDTSKAYGTLTCNFKAMVGTKTLTPITKNYPNSSGDFFTVTKFNYYISNVKLKKADGGYFVEENSYHLIRHIDSITNFQMKNIPDGNYTGIEFLLGVDSLHNVSGAQSGDLDPANLMFWDWNTGYIFYKLEGRFNNANHSDEEFALHVGGFGGAYSCLQNVSLTFPNTMSVIRNGTHQLITQVAVDEIFKSPKEIGFDYYYEEVIKGPKIFQELSLNYRDMFTVTTAE